MSYEKDKFKFIYTHTNLDARFDILRKHTGICGESQ